MEFKNVMGMIVAMFGCGAMVVGAWHDKPHVAVMGGLIAYVGCRTMGVKLFGETW